jgi:hypothetical protein
MTDESNIPDYIPDWFDFPSDTGYALEETERKFLEASRRLIKLVWTLDDNERIQYKNNIMAQLEIIVGLASRLQQQGWTRQDYLSWRVFNQSVVYDWEQEEIFE